MGFCFMELSRSKRRHSTEWYSALKRTKGFLEETTVLFGNRSVRNTRRLLETSQGQKKSTMIFLGRVAASPIGMGVEGRKVNKISQLRSRLDCLEAERDLCFF